MDKRSSENSASQQQQQEETSNDRPPQERLNQGPERYPSIAAGDGAEQQPHVVGWGASVMGPPSVPSAHPLNSQAATGEFSNIPHPPAYGDASAIDEGVRGDGVQGEHSESARPYETPLPRDTAAPIHASEGVKGVDFKQNNQYVQMAPVPGSASSGKSPMDMILENLNKFGKKAEDVTGNLWNHLTAGQSIADSAWGRLNLGAKVLIEGGLENVFKQTFEVSTNEQLLKSYACYLSTSTGPVIGTLYLSSFKIAFCSDRPLQHFITPDQNVSSYYKVIIPLEKVKVVNPSVNPQKPAEKYIQIVTIDDYEFWFMGFVNYDKGLKNLQEAIQCRSFQ